MPKIKIDKLDNKSLVNFELDNIESKVKELQTYLIINKINTSVSKDGLISISEDDQDKLHKEILLQIKVQDAIFNWIPLLEKLRETKGDEAIETRGDIEINGLYRNRD